MRHSLQWLVAKCASSSILPLRVIYWHHYNFAAKCSYYPPLCTQPDLWPDAIEIVYILKNVFNCLYQSKILMTIKQSGHHMPQYPGPILNSLSLAMREAGTVLAEMECYRVWVHSAYAQLFLLFWGDQARLPAFLHGNPSNVIRVEISLIISIVPWKVVFVVDGA